MGTVLASETELQEAYQCDRVAGSYVAERFESELNRLLHEAQVGAVNRVMRRCRPVRTLEIAPGPARVTRDVKLAGELVCLEFNESMIQEGRRWCTSSARWLRGNAFQLPLTQEFDFVYSLRFIRHFKRDDRQRLYEQIRGVLRPGGWMVVDAVNGRVSGPLRDANPEQYPIYDKLYRDQEELRHELTASGFKVFEVLPVQRWFSAQFRVQVVLGPRSRTFCRWAIQALERLSHKEPLEWIVTCRRE